MKDFKGHKPFENVQIEKKEKQQLMTDIFHSMFPGIILWKEKD